MLESQKTDKTLTSLQIRRFFNENMHEIDQGKGSPHLESLTSLAMLLGNQFIGERDRHLFTDVLRAVKAEGVDHLTGNELAVAQQIVRDVASELRETHGHIPRSKLPILIQLGQIYWVDPLSTDD